MEKLTPEATVRETFEFFNASEGGGLQVAPVTYQQAPDDTRLAIYIRGDHEMASIVMAELMSRINDLMDLAQQKEASSEPENSRILT
jgi:hypothetical protein